MSNQNSLFTTESELHQTFMEKIKSGEECICSTCGRYAKVYRRRIHTSIALQLIKAYKLGASDVYVHTSMLISKEIQGMSGADFPLARFWGLITNMPTPSEEDKASSGLWKLTTAGKNFVLKQTSISECALIYNNEVLKFEGDLVSIEECLGKKFSYSELMDA